MSGEKFLNVVIELLRGGDAAIVEQCRETPGAKMLAAEVLASDATARGDFGSASSLGDYLKALARRAPRGRRSAPNREVEQRSARQVPEVQALAPAAPPAVERTTASASPAPAPAPRARLSLSDASRLLRLPLSDIPASNHESLSAVLGAAGLLVERDGAGDLIVDRATAQRLNIAGRERLIVSLYAAFPGLGKLPAGQIRFA